MPEAIRAIDFMYYVATPEFIEQWNRAKEGELLCRMEKAIGGLPKFDSIETMLGKMDEAGPPKRQQPWAVPIALHLYGGRGAAVFVRYQLRRFDPSLFVVAHPETVDPVP